MVLVHTPAGNVEVATFRADSPTSDGRRPDRITFCSARDDVSRRDFTVNGILYDPVEEEILDWVGGRDDLAKKIVRTIGNPHERFEEDKLRLLRAVRFAAGLGFAVESDTYQAMCDMAAQVLDVSIERIRDELCAIVRGGHGGRGLRLLHDTGLLKTILPEVEAMSGVEQPPQFHPEGDVFEHTCMMLDAMVADPSIELAVAVLLHDVGKPQTQTFAERIRFDEHHTAGAEMSRDICRRLRFSNDQIEQIVLLVESHMRFAVVTRMKVSTLKRLLGLPRFDEHLELHRLDCITSHGKLDHYQFVLDKLAEFGEEEIKPEPLLTGADLIAMGYSPGPLFRQILSGVEEEQLEGRITTADAAKEWVKQHFPKDKAEG